MSSRRLNPEYEARLQQAQVLLEELESQTPLALSGLGAVPPKPGVYLISEGDSPLYVGRTRNLRQRFRNHTSGRPEQSAFAFRLARKDSGHLKATYKPVGSRKHLMQDPSFRSAFEQNIKRIKAMNARFVVIDCPLMQHIFEAYAAVSLRTPHNEFTTS